MDQGHSFNLEKEVNNWAEMLKTKPSLTESDVEEMKSHFYDSFESLLEKGLNEKEAFILARLRMGDSYELDEAYKEANQPVIQMRRSTYILAGVLAYFVAYYFILSSSKLLVIFLLKFGVEAYDTVLWLSRYLITWHFLLLTFLVSIYFLETKTIAFLKKSSLTPKKTVIILLLTILLAISNMMLFPEIKNMLMDNLIFVSNMAHYYRYFDFSFPFFMCLGFIFIYSKYYKSTKF